MDNDREVLDKAKELLKRDIAPHAEKIDEQPEALGWALKLLCESDLMALRRPLADGGPELSEDGFKEFQEIIARYSGVLAFLQAQHQTAVAMISQSDNESLRQEYLPLMGDGRKLVGIGLSQLRSVPSRVKCSEVSDGYVFDGSVPWITGWSFYPEFLVGGVLPDGRIVVALAPLANCSTGAGQISVGEPLPLAAMQSALTVSADLVSWHAPFSSVVLVRPADWIQRNDLINVTFQSHFAIGCALAGLDVLRRVFEQKKLGFIGSAHERLAAELAECRSQLWSSRPDPDDPVRVQERIGLRAWAIDLAVRCAHAAVTSSSGAANLLSNPAQRIYREALLFTVSAQTTAIMEATLERLVR